jgi:hypothetical protein
MRIVDIWENVVWAEFQTQKPIYHWLFRQSSGFFVYELQQSSFYGKCNSSEKTWGEKSGIILWHDECNRKYFQTHSTSEDHLVKSTVTCSHDQSIVRYDANAPFSLMKQQLFSGYLHAAAIFQVDTNFGTWSKYFELEKKTMLRSYYYLLLSGWPIVNTTLSWHFPYHPKSNLRTLLSVQAKKDHRIWTWTT